MRRRQRVRLVQASKQSKVRLAVKAVLEEAELHGWRLNLAESKELGGIVFYVLERYEPCEA